MCLASFSTLVELLSLPPSSLLAVHRSKREARDVRRRVEATERLRQERKRQQEVNVSRKKRERDQHK